MGQGEKKTRMKEDKSDEGPAHGDAHRCWGCRVPVLVAPLQLLLGVAVAVVAFLMLAASPSLMARETPHWAGIILCLVAVVGLILYCITSHPDERNFMQFIFKLLYFILCTIGLVISVLVMAFAGHHHSQTSNFKACEKAGEDCICTLDPDDPIARTFTYKEVSDCDVITQTLPTYFLVQIVLNLAQACVCAAGAFIMWQHRYQVFFVGLQIGSPSSKQWQKV